jgi:hypothetical protein
MIHNNQISFDDVYSILEWHKNNHSTPNSLPVDVVFNIFKQRMEGRTLREIAESIDRSPERVRQVVLGVVKICKLSFIWEKC